MQPEKTALESVDEVLVDTPPPYNGPKAGTSSSHTVARALPDIKPTNYMQLTRESEILSGTWIIDPAMIIPSAFLPPLRPQETEETLTNISLEVVQNGGVYAEVFVLSTKQGPMSTTTQRQCVSIHGSCRNGNVIMKLHEVPSERASETRWPMQINCVSGHGSINLYLPRSFRGPLNIQVGNGNVRFSKATKPLVTQFSDINGMQRSFLGDFDANAIQTAGEWAGDTLSGEAKNGTVRIFFDDENIPPVPEAASKGFIERWFGAWL